MGNLCACMDPVGQRLQAEDEMRRQQEQRYQQQHGMPPQHHGPGQPLYGGPPPGHVQGYPAGPQGGGGGGYPGPPPGGGYGFTPTVDFVPPGQPIFPVPPNGRTRALLIGINYFGTSAELRGCINDVHKMKGFLTDAGFSPAPDSMVCLTDDSRDRRMQPTKENILNAANWLTANCLPGDVLFFHFSGHGAQQVDHSGTEEDGMDETICPVDFQRAGMITDNTLFELLVGRLPNGVRLTAVMDCCHSGTGLDLPWLFSLGHPAWQEEDNPHHSVGDVQLFSGCADHQTSADASMYGRAGGAMTTAFVEVVAQHANRGLGYPQLIDQLHRSMRRHGFTQRPQLSASQPFHLQRPFALHDIHPNVNPHIGRQMRRHHRPRYQLARDESFGNSGLGSMLMGGAMGLGLMMMLDS